MQDLRLIGVHEDGEHLLLSGAGDARFRMPVDEALRTAVRRDRPQVGEHQGEGDGELRPREVQALIRAGATADEAAERAGWSVDKVHRYEGPILAEREHVAGLAQAARLRARGGASNGGSAPTLLVRVTERLKERDVAATDASWDSWRGEGGPWTVVLTFAAGGRQRQASWSFDLADRTVSALDDEARWLSEEAHPAEGLIPATQLDAASGRASGVYDVEAEGGLRPDIHDDRAHRHEDADRRDDDADPSDVQRMEVPLDLMSAMRTRSNARGRRRSGARRGSAKAEVPAPPVTPASPATPAPHVTPASHVTELPVEQLLPLDDLTEDLEPAELRASAQDDQPAAKAAPQAGKPARKPGRPTVPAWDEIIFGSRSGNDRSSL